MISINYIKKINEIEEILRKWKRRILTPIGKNSRCKKPAYFKAQPFVFPLPNPLEIDFRKHS